MSTPCIICNTFLHALLAMPLFRTPDQIFEPPTRLERIFSAPLKYLISLLYRFSTRLRSVPKPRTPPIRVVCISDTHTLQYDHIPGGDLLIHAGDLTNDGTIPEIQQALNWLASEQGRRSTWDTDFTIMTAARWSEGICLMFGCDHAVLARRLRISSARSCWATWKARAG